MTAIKLIESLATNPDHKIDMLNPNHVHDELAQKAQQQITELLNKQGKFWCALVPAKEDEPGEEQDSPDNNEDETSQQ